MSVDLRQSLERRSRAYHAAVHVKFPGPWEECPLSECFWDVSAIKMASEGVDVLTARATAEHAAMDAGTHEPAVDDFGNEYLAVTRHSAQEELRERIEQAERDGYEQGRHVRLAEEAQVAATHGYRRGRKDGAAQAEYERTHGEWSA